ncbi:hypothetical protein OGAPHI_006944 [Ogataea philodendri]|uniref:tRNA-dihydrouridine(47) synthase [NAD(P)(+)] n=1 Tax=Ogataea philodendri TaxID=1378263 RepID=A0A9P8NUY9_9ASCO|nr:uncharacterized protein OGAPHI_006944 [Ogataea philodendri]KAH3660358.1 hypothetical protein OGAPHI_006944 [Ogataea philodendri]
MSEIEVDKKRAGEQDSQDRNVKPRLEKGVAPIKAEYLVVGGVTADYNDDEAESSKHTSGEKESKKDKKRGQNKKRDLRQAHDEVKLCSSIIDPNNKKECSFGVDKCRYSHDVQAYLDSKPADIDGVCPVYEAIGYCPAGLKCRWLGSHYSKESGLLLEKENVEKKDHYGEVNWISPATKSQLQKKKFPMPVSDEVVKFLDSVVIVNDEKNSMTKEERELQQDDPAKLNAATYTEARFQTAEKKKLNLKNAKIVSPLTTVGNLPYRRLMRSLGADVTYSEMALALPLIQGSNSEWALPRAHESEYPGFGVQIASAKHWQACKAAEAIQTLTNHVSELNLNCGCPIDMLYRKGEGSALMESPSRLLRILKGMNYSSGEIPVTVKIRMGVKDDKPVAENLVRRVLNETDTAAITLHGRSRQQRYTRAADWEYISKVGAIVKDYNEQQQENKDETDKQPVYFVGNGDCYTHEDWYKATNDEGIDSVMVARGALIKPWIFEEVEAQQYLDKSSSERLGYLEKYAKFALQHWGSDEYGVNSARRYLCEFISFTHRYIPVGILERLPPKLNERPPPWKGRNDLETLLGSPDYKDWIKITEMFLGKAGDGFSFIPKHKSNSVFVNGVEILDFAGLLVFSKLFLDCEQLKHQGESFVDDQCEEQGESTQISVSLRIESSGLNLRPRLVNSNRTSHRVILVSMELIGDLVHSVEGVDEQHKNETKNTL